MRRAALTLATALALVASPLAARDLAGRYRLAEGPDAAGELVLSPDGRFAYALAVGALDEQARGRWVRRGEEACLTTEPTPRPPEFRRVDPRPDQEATVLVESESGEGLAGFNVTVGFDSGEPITHYTQYYGWSLPPDERRVPRWVALSDPTHRYPSPRYPLTGGKLRAAFVPYDFGVPDFREACFGARGKDFVLRRAEGEMKFRRVGN